MKGKSLLNRLNFRLRIGKNITVFFMIAKTLSTSGLISKVGEDQHIIMWDLDGCTLKQAEDALREIQSKYNLADIFITSDKTGSYRALCFNVVDIKSFLRILIDTRYVDSQFIHYTAKQNKATIRLLEKPDRGILDIVSTLYSYPQPIPEKIVRAIYDTGLVKQGITIGSKDI